MAGVIIEAKALLTVTLTDRRFGKLVNGRKEGRNGLNYIFFAEPSEVGQNLRTLSHKV